MRHAWCACLIALLGLVMGFGCSSASNNRDGSVGGDPCKDNFDPLCDETCISSVDCGADLYCGPDDKCTADCSPDGDECGEGYICIAHGRCVETCAEVEVNLDLIVPTVFLLIDQSGSMNQNFSGMERYDAVRAALSDPASGVVWAMQDQMYFGAALYTSHGGFGGGDCPILQTVLPSLGNAQPIQELLDDNRPDGDTPTGESIRDAVGVIKNNPPAPGEPSLNLILLATDGEPDTCDVPNGNVALGRENSIENTQYAFSQGVRVVPLSVGDNVGTAHLQDIANAGSGLPIDGPDNAPYYVANDPAELVASFDEIVQGARGCIFALDGKVEPIEYASYGEVLLNGSPLGFEDPDGWRLIDQSTLELLGAACATFLADDQVSLEATFPCGTVATE